MEIIKFPFDSVAFFERCVRNKTIPRNDFEKQAILMRLIEDFKDDTFYSEQDVDGSIKKYFEDYALLRREFVNFGYMGRDASGAKYWVTKRKLTKEDVSKNTILRRHAKVFGVLDEK
ncbi:MAG: hypothetical protein A2Z88_10550 [Omnitrophica WOR_2 bacterium GWA2_47_8]|nr:MAG: hypothetical protein A2Z88_10550 [Omnitrophica WOR_2 bacterium GWA2_47_8]